MSIRSIRSNRHSDHFDLNSSRVVAPKFVHLDSSCHLLQSAPSDADPRGYVILFEPPDPYGTYVMGVDASQGISGWNRLRRKSDDLYVDNGAIEIVCKGRPGRPDRHVAEFCAPVDAYELADVANLLGRYYGGAQDEGQALSVVEVTGPGHHTLRRMIDNHGYTNQYIWKYRDMIQLAPTAKLGWVASRQSVESLWTMSLHHMAGRKVLIRSTYLVEEFANCQKDAFRKNIAEAVGATAHDDRVRAFQLALWGAHDWANPVGTVESPEVRTDNQGVESDWQNTDISYDDMIMEWREFM